MPNTVRPVLFTASDKRKKDQPIPKKLQLTYEFFILIHSYLLE